MGAHLLAFDWVVRCGAGLPLSFVLAYSVGKLADRRETYAGIVVVIVGQFLTLVEDSAVGLSILPVTAAIALAAWGIGLYVRSETAKRADRAAGHTPAGAHA
jgi:4-amino-4-deoxy-L-arabinose transferase-like glycosyltransferase